ncbi:hypothetical protein [Haloarchaeobius litoreus]|uniref:Uncharacterized protein n=1 Tax=Haloarchaeobius litoreus TaxID=755306 RepID=A0ABD6DMG8_9EURY|nr:hypothetical protein [Haloarchaeobius litoreus]
MNADSSQLYGAVTSLWTIVAGVVLSFLVVPATVYYLLVVRTAAAPGWPSVGLAGGIAMVPGLVMGTLGLWVAARG